MKGGRLLVAAGVLALLAAVYFNGEKNETKGEERLFAFTPDQVRGMTLDRPDAPLIALEKQHDGWRMVRPLQVAADAGQVEGIVAAATSAPVEKRIGPVSDLAPFGLVRPVTVTFLLTDGGSAVVRVGEMNPDRSLWYVATGEGQEVLAVSRSVGAGLFRNLYELREKRLLPVPTEAIGRVAVEGTVLERGEDGWRMVAPYTLPASRAQVAATLALLVNLRAAGFYDTPEERAAVRPPSIRRLALVVDGVERILEYGTAPNGAGIVMVDGRMARVAPDLFATLPSGPEDFLDRRLLPGAEEDAARIDYRREGLAVSIERGGDGWRLTAPLRDDADRNGVESLLHHLSESEGGVLVAGPGFDPNAYGFDRPFAEATVTDGGGKTRRVVVGRKGEAFFVTATGWQWVSAMKSEEVQSLFPSSPPLDRRFFKIDAASVRTVTVERLGQRFAVESDGAKATMTSPRSVSVRDEPFYRFAWGIVGLAYGADYAGPAPKGAPVATVEVAGKGGVPVNRVAFHKTDDNGYIAVDRLRPRPTRVDGRLVTTELVTLLESLMESIDE